MSTDERLAKVARVLGEHREAEGFYDDVYRNYACTCGWWSTGDQERDWEAHRLAALAPLLDEFAAQDRAKEEA